MELEIKVMWCKGLTAFNFFQKLTIYAAVSITSDEKKLELTQQQKQEQKTPVDHEGEGDPEWNHALKFDLGSLDSLTSGFEHLSVLFELRHQGQFFGDKIIGEVRVPLKSLTESVGIGVVRFVSYEVRSPEGKHNGIIDFSYKIFGVSENHSIGSINPDIHISGYHQHHHHNHLDHSHSYGHGTDSEINVTGYQMHHGHGNNHHMDPNSTSDPGNIQYPKIDLDGWGANNNAIPSAPSLVGGIENGSADQYYPPPPVLYPPPPPHLWRPPPQYPAHLRPPPPPPPPVVYPAPPPPYGDPDPYWGYLSHRPPDYQQPSGGYDQNHHW